MLVTLLPPERSLVVAPHGILGQSFDGSGIAVDGAVDPKPQPGELMTTRAMAEGSIEGGWQDYVMPSPYATFFRYSRFGLTKADPRNVSALSGRKVPFAASSSTSATASHDDGADKTTKASRRRLAEECDPPSPPPPSASPSLPPITGAGWYNGLCSCCANEVADDVDKDILCAQAAINFTCPKTCGGEADEDNCCSLFGYIALESAKADVRQPPPPPPDPRPIAHITRCPCRT